MPAEVQLAVFLSLERIVFGFQGVHFQQNSRKWAKKHICSIFDERFNFEIFNMNSSQRSNNSATLFFL